jgi:hypothetical protein
LASKFIYISQWQQETFRLLRSQENSYMGSEMVIELHDRDGAQVVMHALESYKDRLRSSIDRTNRLLAGFEKTYGVSTAHFLVHMAAEDLAGGDLEYVQWAGEAQLLSRLEAELRELENARCQLP